MRTAARPPLHPVQRDRNARVHLIAKEGHKWLTCVAIDFPIRLVQIPVHDHGLQPLMLDGKLYPPRRAVRMIRGFIKDHGITDGAREALAELKEHV